MTLRLKPVNDRVFIITGASSGSGLVTARILKSNKWAEGTLPLLKPHLRQAQQIASSIGIDTAVR
jgi:hypothetical protein